MAIVLNNPEAPATPRQLYKLHELSGEDTRDLKLTMQQASDKINELQSQQLDIGNPTLDEAPFSEPHITIVEGDQRSGKSVYAVGKIRDSYDKDCATIYCRNVLKLNCEVIAYYRHERVIKLKHEGVLKALRVPESYKMHSPMRIFSNIHLYGMPYVYIPSFVYMLRGIQSGFISKGWLLSDESVRGMSARGGMTTMGREWVAEYFQFGKSLLDVIIITHFARQIDAFARMIPTQRVHCTYDKNTRRVHFTLRKKGEQGETEHSFYAPEYWGNYRTNEKVNQ